MSCDSSKGDPADDCFTGAGTMKVTPEQLCEGSLCSFSSVSGSDSPP